jgi:hypothetical protein
MLLGATGREGEEGEKAEIIRRGITSWLHVHICSNNLHLEYSQTQSVFCVYINMSDSLLSPATTPLSHPFSLAMCSCLRRFGMQVLFYLGAEDLGLDLLPTAAIIQRAARHIIDVHVLIQVL